MKRSFSPRLRTAAAVLMLVGAQFAALPSARADAHLAPVSAKFATDLAALDGSAPYGAFVHLTPAGYAERAGLLEAHGLKATTDFPSADAVFAVGTLDRIADL